MKKNLLQLLIVFFLSQSINLLAQQVRLSPLTKKYLNQVSNKKADIHSGDYVVKQRNNTYYISALIKVNSEISDFKLIESGSFIGTKAGQVWTVQIPSDKVSEFIKLKGIDYIQLDEPIFADLDSARKTTRVDSAQTGINIPLPLSGKGVVMGILDAGFDYTHPTLFDTTGIVYRVKKIWEQKNSGIPPLGYIYGNEMIDTTQMWSDGYDVNSFSHGTHVVGIASGSGFGSSTNNKRLRGAAYESDLVLVGIKPDPDNWTSTGMSDIIDGLNYIYAYAASVGKPAIANLSWGCSIGSHDGLSLFNLACDNLTGAGKLFVCSAGNNGEKNLHLSKSFSTTDTLLKTFVTFSASLNPKRTWLDVWGEHAKTFDINITLYAGTNAGNTTGWITLDDSMHQFTLKGANGDTLFIDQFSSMAEFNAKPRMLLDMTNRTTDRIMIAVRSADGIVHLWTGFVKDYSGYYGDFTNFGQTWATVGNKDITISDMAAGASAIAVGAYASKITFTNIAGSTLSYSSYVRGNIVPFSSHGPTADLRVKPDIAGPGLTIASAISSFDVSYQTGGANRSNVITCYHDNLANKDYCYAEMSGTSMSSPMTSGIVALMLQANPVLTPSETIDILRQTAIQDNFTGNVSSGSNLWGYGKINAYRAVVAAFNSTGIINSSDKSMEIVMYPIPNNGLFSVNIDSKQEQTIILRVVDVLGKEIDHKQLKLNVGNNQLSFDYTVLSKGIYFLNINSGEGNSSMRFIRQ